MAYVDYSTTSRGNALNSEDPALLVNEEEEVCELESLETLDGDSEGKLLQAEDPDADDIVANTDYSAFGYAPGSGGDMPDGGSFEHYKLTEQQSAQVSEFRAAFSSGTLSPEMQSRFEDFVTQMVVDNGGLIDPNALVQQVLKDSYLESTTDLRLYAEKVKFFNEIKKQIREELKAARECLKALPEDAKEDAAVDFSKTPIQSQWFGDPAVTGKPDPNDKCTTKEQLESYIKDMEDQMSNVGDDAQLANTDLQNCLQKQQQTLQMMCNISKLLYDTAVSVIRKIGG